MMFLKEVKMIFRLSDTIPTISITLLVQHGDGTPGVEHTGLTVAWKH